MGGRAGRRHGAVMELGKAPVQSAVEGRAARVITHLPGSMSMSRRTLAVALFAGVVGGAAIGLGAIALDEQPVTIDQVPQAVRATIESHLAGGTIREIERSTDGPRVVYEIEIVGPAGQFELAVAENGALLGVEQEGQAREVSVTEVPLGKAPAAVRSAFRKVGSGATPAKVQQIVAGGRTVFEIDFPQSDGMASVELTEAGEVMELEMPVPAPNLPQTVRDALEQAFPGANVLEASSVQLSYFEVEIQQKDGRKREVVVMANGRMGGDDDDDDDGDDDDGDGDDDDDDGDGDDD
jgi:hypothetical protein